MSNHVPFETEDLVAVFGGEIGKEGKYANRVTICRTLAVGELDLLVEESTGRYSRLGTHIVSKGLCVKLEMDPGNLASRKALLPQLGDLVLSYEKEAFKNEEATQTTGILYKISYKLGKPYTYTLISGEEMKEISANSLIVLQRRSQD